jgi:hypothetical protein
MLVQEDGGSACGPVDLLFLLIAGLLACEDRAV